MHALTLSESLCQQLWLPRAQLSSCMPSVRQICMAGNADMSCLWAAENTLVLTPHATATQHCQGIAQLLDNRQEQALSDYSMHYQTHLWFCCLIKGRAQSFGDGHSIQMAPVLLVVDNHRRQKNNPASSSSNTFCALLFKLSLQHTM